MAAAQRSPAISNKATRATSRARVPSRDLHARGERGATHLSVVHHGVFHEGGDIGWGDAAGVKVDLLQRARVRR